MMLSRYGDLMLTMGFTASAIVVAYSAIPGQPEAFRSKTPMIDLGELRQGQVYEADFELKNSHREAVTITRTLESCGCSDLRLSSETVSPGATAQLSAKWRTGNRRGKSAVSIVVDYQLEGGSQGRTELQLLGNVAADIGYEPDPIEVAAEQSTDLRIQFSPGKLATFELLKAQCSHSAFSAELDKQNKCVLLRFDSAKWIAAEPSLTVLTVWTTNPRDAVMYLDITVR